MGLERGNAGLRCSGIISKASEFCCEQLISEEGLGGFNGTALWADGGESVSSTARSLEGVWGLQILSTCNVTTEQNHISGIHQSQGLIMQGKKIRCSK